MAGDDRVQQGAIVTSAVAQRGTAILMSTALVVYIGRQGTAFEVGMVATVFWFGIMVFSPVWGTIADLTGRHREVVIGTSVLAMVTMLPLSVVSGVFESLASRTVYAIFAAGFIPVMLTIVNARGSLSTRGKAVGIFNSAVAAGLLFGRFTSGFLLEYLTRSSLFLVVAGICGVTALAAMIIEDHTPSGVDSLTREKFVSEVRTRLFPAAEDRAHLRTNGLQWLYMATFLRNMAILGSGSLMPIYILQEIGISEVYMGILLTVNPVLQIGLMYGSGHFADRFGRKPLIGGGLAFSGLYIILIGLAAIPGDVFTRVGLAVASFVLLAIGFSALKSGAVAFIGDVAPEDRESEMQGIRETARGFGGVVGPLAFGGAATLFGYTTTFVVGGLLPLLGCAFVLWRLRESHTDTTSLIPV